MNKHCGRGENIPITGRETFISRSSKRAGECRAGSTRLALCIGDVVVEDEKTMAVCLSVG
jgi:hypothetical protein